MRVEFVVPQNGPERLAAEASIIFDDGTPLAGMKLVGFSVWRSAEGELLVSFPSRAFGIQTDRRFFDYLRSQDGTASTARNVKDWILKQYRIFKDPTPTPTPTLHDSVGARVETGEITPKVKRVPVVHLGVATRVAFPVCGSQLHPATRTTRFSEEVTCKRCKKK